MTSYVSPHKARINKHIAECKKALADAGATPKFIASVRGHYIPIGEDNYSAEVMTLFDADELEKIARKGVNAEIEPLGGDRFDYAEAMTSFGASYRLLNLRGGKVAPPAAEAVPEKASGLRQRAFDWFTKDIRDLADDLALVRAYDDHFCDGTDAEAVLYEKWRYSRLNRMIERILRKQLETEEVRAKEAKKKLGNLADRNKEKTLRKEAKTREALTRLEAAAINRPTAPRKTLHGIVAKQMTAAGSPTKDWFVRAVDQAAGNRKRGAPKKRKGGKP